MVENYHKNMKLNLLNISITQSEPKYIHSQLAQIYVAILISGWTLRDQHCPPRIL